MKLSAILIVLSISVVLTTTAGFAAESFTGPVDIAGNLNVNNGNIDVNSGPSTGHIFVDSTKGVFLDGGDDTFFSETTPDFLTFTVGGVTGLQINSQQNVILSEGRGLFFDGGGDTYIIESEDDEISVYTKSIKGITITETGVEIPTGKIKNTGGDICIGNGC